MNFLPNKVNYRIPVLDGGLNTSWTDLSAPQNQSPDLYGVQFDNIGAVGSAYGYYKLNTTKLSSSPIDGLHDYYNAPQRQEKLLAVCGGVVWETSETAAGATFIPVSGSTNVYRSGVDVCIRQVDDQAYLTNGYDTPCRYDGSCLRTVGVSAVVGTASAALGVGGSLTTGAVYTYYLSGVNERGTESNAAQITSPLTMVGGAYGSVALTDIPSYPQCAGVVTKYLYRNTAGASTTWYRVTALSASQTSYVDTASDSVLVTEAQTDNDTPPRCRWWWYHRGRMFAAGDPDNPMRLYFSDPSNTEVWPSSNYIEIGKGDGYPITGIRIVGNSLMIHKGSPSGQEAAIYILYMPDDITATDISNWYVIRSPSAYATVSDKAMAYMDNMLAYLDRHGLYVTTGEQMSPGPAASEVGQYLSMSRSDDIQGEIDSIDGSMMQKCTLAQHGDKLWLSVPSGPGVVANNRIYTYDYSLASKQRGQGAWSRYADLGINNFAVYDGDLVGGSSTDGYVYRIDHGHMADDADPYCLFCTMQIAGNKEHWEMTKIWRYLRVTVGTPGNWTLAVDWVVDGGNTNTGGDIINLSSGGSEWEYSAWDSAVWDSGGSLKTVRVNLAGCVGRTIQFRFWSWMRDTWWKLYRIEVEYNLRSRRQ